MILTKELLKNLELKCGDLSAERCAEINEMKIKNPYYPWAYFTPGEFFVAEAMFMLCMNRLHMYMHFIQC